MLLTLFHLSVNIVELFVPLTTVESVFDNLEIKANKQKRSHNFKEDILMTLKFMFLAPIAITNYCDSHTSYTEKSIWFQQ